MLNHSCNNCRDYYSSEVNKYFSDMDYKVEVLSGEDSCSFCKLESDYKQFVKYNYDDYFTIEFKDDDLYKILDHNKRYKRNTLGKKLKSVGFSNTDGKWFFEIDRINNKMTKKFNEVFGLLIEYDVYERPSNKKIS